MVLHGSSTCDGTAKGLPPEVLSSTARWKEALQSFQDRIGAGSCHFWYILCCLSQLRKQVFQFSRFFPSIVYTLYTCCIHQVPETYEFDRQKAPPDFPSRPWAATVWRQRPSASILSSRPGRHRTSSEHVLVFVASSAWFLDVFGSHFGMFTYVYRLR